VASLCIECERLWKEYSATMHEYLGLNANSIADPDIQPGDGSPRSDLKLSLVAMKDRIFQHECDAHPDATSGQDAAPAHARTRAGLRPLTLIR